MSNQIKDSMARSQKRVLAVKAPAKIRLPSTAVRTNIYRKIMLLNKESGRMQET